MHTWPEKTKKTKKGWSRGGGQSRNFRYSECKRVRDFRESAAHSPAGSSSAMPLCSSYYTGTGGKERTRVATINLDSTDQWRTRVASFPLVFSPPRRAFSRARLTLFRDLSHRWQMANGNLAPPELASFGDWLELRLGVKVRGFSAPADRPAKRK